MTEWLMSNWQNILVGGIVAAVVVLVIVYMVRSRKKGCGFGCGNCSSCQMPCEKKKDE